MGNRRGPLLRDVVAQTSGNHVDGGNLARLGTLPLRRPPPHLTFDVAISFGEVAETDFVDIDGVKIGEHVDEMFGGGSAELDRHQIGPLDAVEHDPVDERHHVERCIVHRRVGAQPERCRYRHTGAPNGGDDPVLAGHVVGGCQHVAERRTTEHEHGAVSAGDPEREVGAAPGDQVEAERGHSTDDVVDQPLRHWTDANSNEVVRARRVWRHRQAGHGGHRRRAQPGRETPTTLAQLTTDTLTTSPVAGAWTIDPPPR